MNLPKQSRIYQNHHLDSTRWQMYTPRADDIIITTAYKSGTTWTQDIFYQLIYGDKDLKPDRNKVNVWPDAHFMPLDKNGLKQRLEGFSEQRYIKSHLPLDGLPYYPQVKYLIVCRDPRDVFMSFYNHYSQYTDHFYNLLNDPEKLIGAPLPPCPEDPRELWSDWISRGWYSGTPPTENNPLQNHSWVNWFENSNAPIRMDYAVNQDGFLPIAGLYNSGDQCVQQRGRHIVDTVEVEVFQHVQSDCLAGAG